MQPGEIKIIPRIIVDGSKMLWYDSTVGAFGRNAFLFAYRFPEEKEKNMKHVKTLNTRKLQNTIKKGGCGECQTSCQSACKTSCTVGNQTCEQYK